VSNFETLLAATEEEYKSKIENHPLIELVLSGNMKQEHYFGAG